MQAFRFASLAAGVVVVVAYARHAPFNTVYWAGAAGWTIIAVSSASNGQQLIRSITAGTAPDGRKRLVT
jgi:hypothetical protein